MRHIGRTAVIAVSAAALGLLSAAAQATPGARVTGTVLAQGSTPDHDRVGGGVAPPPLTPPDMRARIRRFVKPFGRDAARSG